MGDSKVKIAIFGGGKVGTAMSLEMPGVPVIHRGEDVACEIACICWPAQAVKDFAKACPLASKAYKIAFCNGVWAVEDGADEQGVCYVRAVVKGDRAPAGRKGWRVEDPDAAKALRAAGLNLVCSRDEHRAQLWGKVLYILPLVLALKDEPKRTAKNVVGEPEWSRWFKEITRLAERELGYNITPQVKRAKFLLERLPSDWRPSSSKEEAEYFLQKLNATGTRSKRGQD